MSNTKRKNFKYRPEITGLRFFAIIPVIIYHSNIDALSSGFLGVDVFFVLSGYLITSVILNDIKENKFSLKEFFVNRLRRLYPALLFCLLFFTPVITFIYFPSDLVFFEDSLLYIVTYISNFFFSENTSYFDLAQELQPFLHTWSLGVEEQFYIIFPLFLLSINKLKFRSKVSIVLLAILVSFSTTELVSNAAINTKFYLFPFRFWELLIGVLIGYFLFEKTTIDNKFSGLLSLFGFFIMLSSFFLNINLYKHPGVSTLYVLFGTSLIIIFTNKDTYLYKLLTWRPIYFVGLISYSLYLWHNPFFSIAKYTDLNSKIASVEYFLDFLIIIFSFIMSYISWKVIEEPIRRKKFLTNTQFLFTVFIISGIFIIVSLFNLLSTFSPNQYESNVETLEPTEEILTIVSSPTTTVQLTTTTTIAPTTATVPTTSTTTIAPTTTTTIAPTTTTVLGPVGVNNKYFEGIKDKYFGKNVDINSENINSLFRTIQGSGIHGFVVDNEFQTSCLIEYAPPKNLDICVKNYSENKKNILLTGDSTSYNLYFKLKDALDSDEFTVSLLTVTRCIPLISEYPENYGNFSGKREKCEPSYELIKENIYSYNYDLVLLVYDYVILLQGGIEKYSDMAETSYSDFINELKILSQNNVNLTVVGQFPEYSANSKTTLLDDLKKTTNLPFFNDVKPGYFYSPTDETIFELEDRLKTDMTKNDINFIPFLESICFEGSCMRFVEYKNSYYPFSIDYVHISPMAAEVVVNNLIIPNIPILSEK